MRKKATGPGWLFGAARTSAATPFISRASALVTLVLFTLMGLTLGWSPPLSPAARAAPPTQTALVWLADASGSMPEADPERFWVDAVSLGAGLAPANSRLAFVAVNDAIVAQTPLLDTANKENRATIQRTAQNTLCTGYTDFALGLSAALETLNTSDALDKHLFFAADISEGGFLLRSRDYTHVTSAMTALTDQFVAKGVRTHLLFLRKPQENQPFLSLWEDLAARTGGEITFLENPAALARTAETLYLDT